MSQQQLFLSLVMSVLMAVNGIREMRHNAGFGILLVAIPCCFWLSRLFGESQ